MMSLHSSLKNACPVFFEKNKLKTKLFPPTEVYLSRLLGLQLAIEGQHSNMTICKVQFASNGTIFVQTLYKASKW